MTGKVLGCRTNWNATLEYLQAHVSPLANGLKIDSTVNQSLCEVSSTRAKGISADSNGAWYFVGFEKFYSLTSMIVTSTSVPRTDRYDVLTSATGNNWNSFSAKNSLYP